MKALKPRAMSGKDYREAVRKLGFPSAAAFSRWINISTRQELNWKNEGVPRGTELLLRLMLHLQKMLRIDNMAEWTDLLDDPAPENPDPPEQQRGKISP